MLTTAVFDTKPYDREYLAQAPGSGRFAWRFHEFRLSTETAAAAKDAQAVCVFTDGRTHRPRPSSRNSAASSSTPR